MCGCTRAICMSGAVAVKCMFTTKTHATDKGHELRHQHTHAIMIVHIVLRTYSGFKGHVVYVLVVYFYSMLTLINYLSALFCKLSTRKQNESTLLI